MLLRISLSYLVVVAFMINLSLMVFCQDTQQQVYWKYLAPLQYYDNEENGYQGTFSIQDDMLSFDDPKILNDHSSLIVFPLPLHKLNIQMQPNFHYFMLKDTFVPTKDDGGKSQQLESKTISSQPAIHQSLFLSPPIQENTPLLSEQILDSNLSPIPATIEIPSQQEVNEVPKTLTVAPDQVSVKMLESYKTQTNLNESLSTGNNQTNTTFSLTKQGRIHQLIIMKIVVGTSVMIFLLTIGALAGIILQILYIYRCFCWKKKIHGKGPLPLLLPTEFKN